MKHRHLKHPQPSADLIRCTERMAKFDIDPKAMDQIFPEGQGPEMTQEQIRAMEKLG